MSFVESVDKKYRYFQWKQEKFNFFKSIAMSNTREIQNQREFLTYSVTSEDLTIRERSFDNSKGLRKDFTYYDVQPCPSCE